MDVLKVRRQLIDDYKFFPTGQFAVISTARSRDLKSKG